MTGQAEGRDSITYRNQRELDLITALAAQLFPRRSPSSVQRVEDGVSTHVYRICRGDEVFYLRVLPELGASFAPEARVHMLLRARNVKVPEVVYLEHFNEALQRSVMVTTEIKGHPVGHYSSHEALQKILSEAGRDLAMINSLEVQGFGWIRRDNGALAKLEAEHPTYRAFVLDQLDEYLALLAEHALERQEVAAVWKILAGREAWLGIEQAWLAHGDLDVTHIYQDASQYTGIIDFGEIRGGDPFYDLGHFKMHDGETLPTPALPLLLAGYRDVAQLPDDVVQRISFASLVVAIKAVARWLRKRPENPRQHVGIRSIKGGIEMLRTP